MITFFSTLTGNFITASGYPITMSNEEQQIQLHELNPPPSITIPTSLMEEGGDILKTFQKVLEFEII